MLVSDTLWLPASAHTLELFFFFLAFAETVALRSERNNIYAKNDSCFESFLIGCEHSPISGILKICLVFTWSCKNSSCTILVEGRDKLQATCLITDY